MNVVGKYSVIKNCNKKVNVDNILCIFVMMTVSLITSTKTRPCIKDEIRNDIQRIYFTRVG